MTTGLRLPYDGTKNEHKRREPFVLVLLYLWVWVFAIDGELFFNFLHSLVADNVLNAAGIFLCRFLGNPEDLCEHILEQLVTAGDAFCLGG